MEFDHFWPIFSLVMSMFSFSYGSHINKMKFKLHKVKNKTTSSLLNSSVTLKYEYENMVLVTNDPPARGGNNK